MKLCPYPFSRLQTSNYEGRFKELRGTFLPCVPSWFSEEYFKIKRENSLENIWNGTAAIELRKRMYDGDFSFCNRKACQIPLFSVEELADRNMVFNETPVLAQNIEAIKRKDPRMPGGPSSLYLTSDYTCNLKCPICRSERVTNGAPSTRSALEEYKYVQSVRRTLEVIKMSNGGELFYSKLQRRLLKSFNERDFPRLRRVHVVTNGTLFNEKTYQALMPGAKYIRDVCISIDAGSRAVYEKVRGPYWKQVLSNVKWIGKMRKLGTFDYLSFHIIIVKENYRDVPRMVELARKNHVDRVLVQPFLQGPEQGYVYGEQAIHLPTHPKYLDFVEIMKRYADDPILYTYLDIPGFQKKISRDVDIQKAYTFYLKAEEAFKCGDLVRALEHINDSIGLNPVDYACEKRVEINRAFGRGDKSE